VHWLRRLECSLWAEIALLQYHNLRIIIPIMLARISNMLNMLLIAGQCRITSTIHPVRIAVFAILPAVPIWLR